MTNTYHFHTIRLWEEADRIRSGELAELALLLLCEDQPTEATLIEERRLIQALDAPQVVRTELLAVATMIGTRYFSRELLQDLFREEMEMLKGASSIEDWILEGRPAARPVVLSWVSARSC